MLEMPCQMSGKQYYTPSNNFIIIKIITHIISLQHISSIVSDLQARPTYVNNENIPQIYKIIKVTCQFGIKSHPYEVL